MPLSHLKVDRVVIGQRVMGEAYAKKLCSPVNVTLCLALHAGQVYAMSLDSRGSDST